MLPIINVKEPTLTQVNAAFEAHFAPTSNHVCECSLFRQLKQQQDVNKVFEDWSTTRKDSYTITVHKHHLWELLQQDKDYVWTEKNEQAFNNLKQSFSREGCVSYFDNHKETFIYTDARPYWISAILLQKLRNQENFKIIAYSSRALISAEKFIRSLNVNV